VPPDALDMSNPSLNHKIHAATVLLSRVGYCPSLLYRRNIHPRIVKAMNRVVASGPGRRFLSLPPGTFVRNLGPITHLPQSTTPPAFEVKYKQSFLPAGPGYIPVNWRILPVKLDPRVQVQFKARIRLFTHGGFTSAIYGQIRCEEGFPFSDFVTMVRSIESGNTRDPFIFKVRNAVNAWEATAEELLQHLSESLLRGISTSESSASESLTLEPDFLMMDIGRCTPAIDVEGANDALAHLLMLDMDDRRQLAHGRNAQLGLYKTDWIGLSSKRFLFCETSRPWPSPDRTTRTSQHRGVVLWRLYSTIELARMQKLLAIYLTDRFEAATLEMTRAENKSGDFLQTLLKANFYDDRIVALAMDHSNVREQLHGHDEALYQALAQEIRLEEQETKLQTATKDFLASVHSWKPGVSKLLDLAKLLPGK
jgi:hypothetical protein